MSLGEGILTLLQSDIGENRSYVNITRFILNIYIYFYFIVDVFRACLRQQTWPHFLP